MIRGKHQTKWDFVGAPVRWYLPVFLLTCGWMVAPDPWSAGEIGAWARGSIMTALVLWPRSGNGVAKREELGRTGLDSRST